MTRLEMRLLLLLIPGVLSVASVRAQDHSPWSEKPKNLQVLKKDWPGERLRPVMTGFTRALGVRCSYCHLGHEGQPLSTMDFASDENPNKNRAREMLRMLQDINDHLKKIQPSGDQRVNMWCDTCHHGRPRPMRLTDELNEQYRKGGVTAALAHYADLKKNFYAAGAYNFGEASLNEFGYELLEGKDTAGAIQVFQLNAANFPQSGNTWDSLAEAEEKAGDTKSARSHYRKALHLDPANQHASQRLKEIDQRP